ncbi:MAG: hypothetical protein DMF78_11405 [Acidobacteria bacterium]|nr:MAG: hypothetical protein DMF78_11405 [Acidobacteriota bacterium]
MKRYSGWQQEAADLFFADLMGEPLPPPRVWTRSASTPPLMSAWPRAGWPFAGVVPPSRAVVEQNDLGEAIPLNGRGRFRHEPLGGEAGDNVEARWNVDAATASGSTVDIVVHLHGYGTPGSDFLARKAALAGLDMLDAAGAVRVRASSVPTLALVPRGRHVEGVRWLFDRLPDPAAFDALIAAAIAWLCTTVLRLPSGSTLVRGRLTLMAHSGGGAGLSALLAKGLDPDEVVCFDSMYGEDTPIRRWAEARIASPRAARSGLRVFYTGCSAPLPDYPAGRWIERPGGDPTYQQPGSWSWSEGDRKWRLTTTEVNARRLQHALDGALSRVTGGGAALAGRFRVERTSVGHNDIPARYSAPLLDDIAVTVPKATAPPPATTRPACVANDDWLTRSPRKPGGDDPKPPRPGRAAEAAVVDVEDVYAPPGGRAYSPSSSAAVFRTAPAPVAVTPASEWPEPTTDADGASQRALRALGVGAAGIAGFAGPGLAALRPIAAAFGEAALVELLRRLRYTPAQLAAPPHSFANDAALTRAFGRAVPRPVILALRTLLAIPGHFRELARQAGNEPEAFALENLGWLLLQSLRDDVRSASGLNFWMPSSPTFVTPFANPVPGMSSQAARLIVARMLIDTTLDNADYLARYGAWRGRAARHWRLETGRETSTMRPAGVPFYTEPFTIPASINIAAQRTQVQAAWARRLADVDAGRTTVPLTQCDNSYLTSLRLMSRVSLRGLQLRAQFPSPATAPSLASLTGLGAVQPAFEAAFQAVVDLGWNDLLFETQGMGCFRGKKVPGSPAAARRMSEHSMGIAIDLNAFENAQNTAGAMDPRIVALFEAFRFRWGRGFPTPDPMHFEYAG